MLDPKVKYKAASVIKPTIDGPDNNPKEPTPHLLFSLSKDEDVHRSTSFDTVGSITPRGMQRSSTRTTTLSIEQKYTKAESIPMVSSGDAQSWTVRQSESVPSDGEYEAEEMVKVKKSRFTVTHMGFSKCFVLYEFPNN